MKSLPSHYLRSKLYLSSNTIQTPLGTMIAISDEQSLLFLSFTDAPHLERRLTVFQKKMRRAIQEFLTPPLASITRELAEYFRGTLHTFNTPIALQGTQFQLNTWNALRSIPYGSTCSYTELSENIGFKTAFRAAANANSRNQLPIIIPCHRVINKNGSLAGYYGGMERKAWLLQHEKRFIKSEI